MRWIVRLRLRRLLDGAPCGYAALRGWLEGHHWPIVSRPFRHARQPR